MKAKLASVLNEVNSVSPELIEKINTCAKLAKQASKRPRMVHEPVVYSWNRYHDADKLSALLDERITQLRVECDNRKRKVNRCVKKSIAKELLVTFR